jgi:hypothetical protein
MSVESVRVSNELKIEQCPHCGVAKPYVGVLGMNQIQYVYKPRPNRLWAFYACSSCEKPIMAGAEAWGSLSVEITPSPRTFADEIPHEPREFLRQAASCLHAPSGAILLCASAVDSMLKRKGLAEGNLNRRIKEAASQHILTQDMAEWAHHVRLEANDQRHADDTAGFPTREQAEQSLKFVETLAEILFVLPERVRHGIKEATKQAKPTGENT